MTSLKSPLPWVIACAALASATIVASAIALHYRSASLHIGDAAKVAASELVAATEARAESETQAAATAARERIQAAQDAALEEASRHDGDLAGSLHRIGAGEPVDDVMPPAPPAPPAPEAVPLVTEPQAPIGDGTTWLVLDPVGDDLVPPAPRLRPGLPGAVRMPGGTWLPTPLDVATDQLTHYCTVGYPLAVSEAIVAAREAEATKWASELEVRRVRWLERRVDAELDAAAQWSTWQVVLGGAAIATAALGAGYLAGRLAP